jgi:uncharacterized protein YwgA
MLSRDETLLLLLYTSPTAQGAMPAIVGSTRLQKLVFLVTRESPVLAQHCAERHEFVAYDFGPYSSRLEKDVERLAGQGLVYFPGAASRPQTVQDLTFDYLMGNVQRPAPNSTLILTEQGVRAVKRIMERLRKDGFEPELIIQEFEKLHGRFTGLNLEELLRFVYAKYPKYALNSKRPDLRPDPDEGDADDDTTDYEDGDGR